MEREQVQKFFERFDNYNEPYYWSAFDIIGIKNGEYDICENVRVGDTYIVDVSLFNRFEEGYESRSILQNLNKIR